MSTEENKPANKETFLSKAKKKLAPLLTIPALSLTFNCGGTCPPPPPGGTPVKIEITLPTTKPSLSFNIF